MDYEKISLDLTPRQVAIVLEALGLYRTFRGSLDLSPQQVAIVLEALGLYRKPKAHDRPYENWKRAGDLIETIIDLEQIAEEMNR